MLPVIMNAVKAHIHLPENILIRHPFEIVQRIQIQMGNKCERHMGFQRLSMKNSDYLINNFLLIICEMIFFEILC